MIEVELPDGSIAEFPDGTPPETIKGALQRRFGGGKQAAPNPSLFRADSDFGDKAGFTLGKFSPTLGMAAARDMFGSHESAGKYLAEKVGGKFEQTDQGPIVRLPSGEAYYVNDPGIDSTDVANFTGNAAAYTPAGRLAATGTTLGSKMLIGGTAAATTDAAMQAGFNDEYDPTRTAIAAGGGVAGEVIGPIVSSAWRGAKNKLMPISTAISKVRKRIGEMGSHLDEQALVRLSSRLDELEATADPKAMIDEAEFGFQFTRGKALNDDKLMNIEEMGRNAMQSRSGEVLRAQDRANFDAAHRWVADKAGRGTDVPGAVDDAAQSVRSQYQEAKQGVRDAYEAASARVAQAPASSANSLPGNIRSGLSDVDLSPENTAKSLRALSILDETFGSDAPLTLRQFDNARKRVSSLYSPTMEPADKMALSRIKSGMDDWLDDVAEKGLIEGDQEAIGLLKEARKARSDMASRFGDGKLSKQADRIVKAMIEDSADPEKLATMIYSTSQVSGPAANRALMTVKKALGSDKQAWEGLRGAVLAKAAKKKGEKAGLKELENNIRELLQSRPTLMKSLYSAKELAELQRFTSALSTLNRTAVDRRSSGTAERIMRFLSGSAPIIGKPLQEAIAEGAVARSMKPNMPPRYSLPVAASAAGAGVVADERR